MRRPEWTWVRKALLAIFLSAIFLSSASATDLLVLMHGSGKVERYDAEGKHLGTFINGLPAPNALMEGPDGRLYVSTGVPGANGTVERFDAKTGLRLGTFINIPAGQPGHLARATGMTWHEGDLLVASQGDGIVKQFDGKTGAWKADVSKASPGGFTQIAMREGRLFLTDFVAHMIRVSDMKGTEAMAPAWTHSDGDAAWGLVFDAEGRAFWSTGRQRILRFDGKENVEWAHGLVTPVWLSFGPDALLYAVNHTGPNVTVWDTKTPNPGGPVRVIGGSEMQLPISVAFTTHAFEPPVQFGNFTPKPSNTGKDWTPDGTAIYNLRAMKGAAAITDFGLDTEGGDRAKLNLLKEPMRLVFTMQDGSRVESSHIAATSEIGPHRVKYAFSPAVDVSAEWVLWLDGQNLRMSFAASGSNFAKAELLIPFDPRAMGTTVLAEEWGAEGIVKAPLIISALDMGQLQLRNDGADPRLDCTFTGSRQHKRINLRIEVLSGTTLARSLVFAPARLEKPSATLTDAEWAKIRRGLISLLQVTPYMVPFEDGSGWLGSPGGILGNNVISDPVTCNMDRNLQWLAGMGDKTAVMGINLNRIAKRTIEFWLNHHMNEDGSLDYVLQKGNISADSNTGVLNSATDYFLSTGDTQFVCDNKAVLLKAVNYFIARDLDDDGLIETFRDGNGNNQFGDTGYDTISSGWKNALVNGQAYKSFLGVAKMMESIGEDALAKDFRQRAVRLRKAYNKTFYDAEKGRYIWWIGKDGKRHDYANPLIQSNAVLYGIAKCLEQDTGLKRGDKEVMQALWDALDAAEYRDTAKGQTVDYMDAKTGSYTGLYWGIPGNLKGVPDAYNFQDFGSHEFPYYCNGCIFPQDTVTTITAFAKAGLKDKAVLIQRQIFKRQHEGIFPNGSGFYMGVVNGSEPAYSILKWDGTPTDYEGIISRDCSFLQTALLTDDPAHELFEGAKASTLEPLQSVYKLDVSGLNQLDLTNPSAARRAWDTLHAAASLQGIVNREGPVLFLRHMPETDDFWWDWLREEGHWLHGQPVIELRDLADAVKTFAPKLKGVVLYDSQVAATALLASTMAGVEDRMALRHDLAADSVFTELVKLPEFPKDAVRLFQPDGTPLFTGKGKIPDTALDSTGSVKNDAYLWAKARYLDSGKCSREFLAYYMDSHWLTNPAPPGQGPNQGLSNTTLANHDFFISQRAFFFDLGVWPEEAPVDDPGQKPGTDAVTLRAILRSMSEWSRGDIFTVGGMVPWLWKYSGPLPGWAGSGGGHHPVHSEWEFARLISAYNGMMDADAMGGMANASFYQHYPLKDSYPQQRKPTVEDLKQRGLIQADGTVRPDAYVALYMGDYDAASWFQQYIPKWWADPQHGKVTCNWAFNPILDRRAPHVVDYVRTHAAATDWFICGDSGMGYLNPGMLTSPRLDPSIGDGWDAWTRRNEAYFRRYDLSIAGFVIEGFGPYMGKRGLDAYARFAPDGMMLQTSEPSLSLAALHGTLPIIGHRMDLDGAPAQAGADLLARVAEEKARFIGGPQFLIARTVLKSPTWHAETIAATKVAPGGERVTFLDAYSFFLLLKTHLTHGTPVSK